LFFVKWNHSHTVWITGAGSGIGKELALALAERGCELILSGKSNEKLQRLSEQIDGKCPVHLLPFDLADATSVADAPQLALKAAGKVDVLFNNGGLSQRAGAGETSELADRMLMEINYFSNIALTKALLGHWRERGGGTVVVTSSLAGKTGFFLRSGYSASKHALHGFYDSLRLEEESAGLKVTLVCPNRVKTDISLSALDGSGRASGETDERLATGISPRECALKIIEAAERV
jgi:dehydrogenase/reductase SDR family member 7B